MTGKKIVTATFRCEDETRTEAKIKAMRQGKTFQDIMNELLGFYLSGEYEKYMEWQEIQNAFGEDE